MTWYANSRQILAVATYSQATAGKGFDCGEYIGGQLVVHIRSMSGAGARIYPSWGVSYDATGPNSGRYAILRTFATGLRVTGLAVMTLPATIMARWCRASFTMGGTTPNIKIGAWAMLKGQH